MCNDIGVLEHTRTANRAQELPHSLPDAWRRESGWESDKKKIDNVKTLELTK